MGLRTHTGGASSPVHGASGCDEQISHVKECIYWPHAVRSLTARVLAAGTATAGSDPFLCLLLVSGQPRRRRYTEGRN